MSAKIGNLVKTISITLFTITLLSVQISSGSTSSSKLEWVDDIGIISASSGDGIIRINWGVAKTDSILKIKYLVYMDTDPNPWDAKPIIMDTNAPLTFEEVENGKTYWFGVRYVCGDDMDNHDGNTNVISAVPDVSGGYMFDWCRSYSTVGKETVLDAGVDADGNIYLAGRLEIDFIRLVDLIPDNKKDERELFGSNFFLLKYSADGDFEWIRVLEVWPTSPRSHCYIAVENNGDVFISGGIRKDYRKGFVVFDGDPKQTKHYNHSIVEGKRHSECQDIFLCKYDKNGEFQWAKTWGGYQKDQPGPIALDDQGNLYITGITMCLPGEEPELITLEELGDTHSKYIAENGYMLLKFDNDGNLLWSKKRWKNFCMYHEQIFRDIAIGKNDDIYICATSNTKFTVYKDQKPIVFDKYGESGFIFKFDKHGDLKWINSIGRYAYSLAVDSTENIYVSGSFGGGDLDPSETRELILSYKDGKGYLCKFDKNGILQWAKNFHSGDERNGSLVVDLNRNDEPYILSRFYGDSPFAERSSWPKYGKSHNNYALGFYSTGDMYWHAEWFSNLYPYKAIKFDSNDNMYIVGTYSQTADLNPGPDSCEVTTKDYPDIFIVKMKPE